MQVKRNNYAIDILLSNTGAYDLLRMAHDLEGDLDAAFAAYSEEVQLDLVGRNTLRSFEDAAASAASAVLQGQPCSAHIGRVLYWNAGLYMTPDKVRRLVVRIKEEGL